jgi:hypothetical protein|tara:strand:- start:619 stop:1017 length:399 start_codon:yes stop_codon:yes gene_type:complete
MKKDKKFIYKTFNNEFKLFLCFLINIFNSNDEIKSFNTAINMLIKYNPTKLIYLFNYYVTNPYDNIIQKGDFEYFENKDYSSDVTDLKENAEYVLNTYNNLRKIISNESLENKKTSMKFIQNLSSLSKLYYS